jgi:MscS family membrane protein
MTWEEFLGTNYFGNTVLDYLWLVGAFIAVLIFKKFISRYISHVIYALIQRSSLSVGREELDKLLVRPLNLFLMLVVVFMASRHIHWPEEWNLRPVEEFGLKRFVSRGFFILVAYSFVAIALRMVDYLGLVLTARAEKTESKLDDQLVPFVVDALKLIIILIATFIVLDNVFKVNITTLIAGLGFIGIALALAAKESIENLLGSITIFFDKPFAVGDMIQLGSTIGVVEKVGFRSTRLRTPDKSYVTIPNKLLTNSELDNLTNRTQRRARFTIGVLYNTKANQLRSIISDIQVMLDENPETGMDSQVRFYEFGESSINILVQYFVNTMDWTIYLKVREEINFNIFEIVRRNGSDFAFPTTSVHLENQGLEKDKI